MKYLQWISTPPMPSYTDDIKRIRRMIITSHDEDSLLRIAAELAEARFLPSTFEEDYGGRKSLSVRQVCVLMQKARQACKDLAVRIRNVMHTEKGRTGE